MLGHCGVTTTWHSTSRGEHEGGLRLHCTASYTMHFSYLQLYSHHERVVLEICPHCTVNYALPTGSKFLPLRKGRHPTKRVTELCCTSHAESCGKSTSNTLRVMNYFAVKHFNVSALSWILSGTTAGPQTMHQFTSGALWTTARRQVCSRLQDDSSVHLEVLHTNCKLTNFLFFPLAWCLHLNLSMSKFHHHVTNLNPDHGRSCKALQPLDMYNYTTKI